ncbi:hypothetical protein Ciccas_012878 [Cichlidogyrus casuarinus]|uniref:Uncharacterized protein n=1 Tax=Cichlidogyrus casuarinus TaxID=1844966 RepID=A0ABD2PNX3_9PLAT
MKCSAAKVEFPVVYMNKRQGDKKTSPHMTQTTNCNVTTDVYQLHTLACSLGPTINYKVSKLLLWAFSFSV